MKKLLLITALLTASPAIAQNVQQSGTVIPGQASYWVTNGIIGNGGNANDSAITSLGVTNATVPGFCVNSGRATAAGRQRLCFGAPLNSPAQITLQNFGTADPQALQFVINGVTIELPSTIGGQFVTASGSFAANDVSCFQGTTAVLIDCGLKVIAGTVTSGVWNGTAVPVAFGGTGGNSAINARTNLGLGTMATQDASAVGITGGTITGMPLPTVSSDVATKSYVDATSAGLHVLSPSRLASTAVLPNTPTYANGSSGVGATLTAGSNAALVVDGTIVNAADIVLVKDQAAPAQNGIYSVTTAGDGSTPWVLTRCSAAACVTQFNTAATMLAGSYTFVTGGSTNANTAWVLFNTVTTVGTTSAIFNIFSNAVAGVTSLNSQTGGLILWTPPQGRITLNSNTPVMTASYAAQTTLYYTSFVGKNVPIYNGTAIAQYQICTAATVGACELSVAMGANFTTNSNFDGFIGIDSGTIRHCYGPAWSSDTVRGTGGGTSELETIDGLQTNKVSMTCRYANASTFTCAVHQCTYVGTIRTGTAGQSNYIFGASASGGTAGNFQVWNMYNRVYVGTIVVDSGAGYVYNSGTVRQARGSAGNQVSFVRGFAEDAITASVGTQILTNGFTGAFGVYGIGLDTTTVLSQLGSIVFSQVPAVTIGIAITSGIFSPGIGLHYIAALETTDGGQGGTFDQASTAYINVGLYQ